MHGSDDLDVKVAALVRRFPPLDENVEELLRAAAAGRADPRAVAALAARDSGLCANLLAMANASCAGAPRGRAIETLDEALELVGVEALAELVGTAYALEAVEGQCPHPRQWQEYVAHSRAISASCRGLAEVRGFPPAERDRVAVAGLTHDIGRVVMMAAGQALSASLLGARPDEMLTIVEDERRACGLDHCRIGFALFRRWDFSATMQDGILRHHTPLLKSDFSFPGAMIFVAHFVLMSDLTGDILARSLRPELLDRLGVTVKDIEAARALCAATEAPPRGNRRPQIAGPAPQAGYTAAGMQGSGRGSDRRRGGARAA